MATESLFSQIEKEGAGVAVLHQLKKIPVPERPALIAEWCAAAGAKHADEEALRYYMWLLLAMREAHGTSAEFRIARAGIDLYGLLPAYHESRECIDRETYQMGKVKRQTLSELKKQILTDIALCWTATKDDGEAAHLSAALLRIAKTAPDQQSLDRMRLALREALEKHICKKERVLGFLADVVREVKNDELAKTLFVGVMRTLQCADFALLLPLFATLPFDTLLRGYQTFGGGTLLAALTRDAEMYRAMHEAIRELHGQLKLSTGRIEIFEPAYWSQPPRVELAIGAKKGYSTPGQESNDFHDVAHELRDQVQAWRAARLLKTEKPTLSNCPVIHLRVYHPEIAMPGRGAPGLNDRYFIRDFVID